MAKEWEDKITYGSWEGDATMMRHYKNGRILARVFIEDQGWKEANSADVATKAAVVDQATWNRMFPDVGLPSFPE